MNATTSAAAASASPSSPATRDRPLVDTHVHIFRSNMPLVPDPRHAPTYEFTAEQLQATLDAHGVQFCVIAAASPWMNCGEYFDQYFRGDPCSRK